MKDQFLERAKQFSMLDFELIEKAYHFAQQAHAGQKRVGGEEFFIHPINVARILLDHKEVHADTAMICAALLHDTVEDTKVELSDIDENFTHEITMLVDALTKIEHSEDVQINHKLTHEKILMHGEKDARVFVIKIADILHNLQTLDVMPQLTKHKLAHEAIDFYAPIAAKLGLKNLELTITHLAKKYYQK